MINILLNRTFRHLFAAQALSLLGSGLCTVALGLLAYDLAGPNAGAVLGTALAIKMMAYVFVSPIAGAIANRFPRRSFLVTLGVCRACMVLMLPFVTAIWQVYILVFLFQAFSAGFTPTFQATIPDILKNERDYTQALSLSRLAYDLESFLSPVLAALLLTFMSFHLLFLGTAIGFLASAGLVLTVTLPSMKKKAADIGFYSRVSRGISIYLKTPRLRGLFALSLTASAAGAMVIVNSVVYVREYLSGSDQDVALLLMAYGIGSMIVAMLLPRILDRVNDRTVMVAGAAFTVVILAASFTLPGFASALVVWMALGSGTAFILTPSGRLLARSSHEEDRPSLFAAHFSLSHACWLITYPLAGWLGAIFGLGLAFVVMATLAAIGGLVAWYLWPRNDELVLEHEHQGIIHDHWHVHDEHHQHNHEGWEGPEPHRHPHIHDKMRHSHVYVIDDHHPLWARQG